jgi:precorrin-6B C5,15-methyltransferase / cobalt-precorrin-6B C5,C15-methyltransferase
MSRPVVVLGLGAEGPSGLSPRARETLASATFLAGGTRHLALVGPTRAETFAIGNNLAELVERLRRRGPDERCVVLASGDPLCYGIGHLLGRTLGRAGIVVEPALSSLQLAFARAGLSWHDAAIGTIHGRPMKEVLLPLLGRPKIGLFTQDGGSPSAVAAFFLEHGLDDYRAIVGENLGAADERLTEAPLPDLLDRPFEDLNFLILLREPAAADDDTARPLTRGIACPPDALFARPEGGPVLLTHADVRAVVLARFWGLPDGPVWDIGAGLGGVAISLARSFPEREVVAIERSPVQGSSLKINRSRLEAYNLRIVEGSAPACLEGEEAPAGIFLGGTGGALDAILDLVFERLRPRGVLVANFVGLENLGRGLDRLRGAGWSPEVTQVSISHGHALAGLTVLTPERPVWVVRAIRP